MSLHRLSSPAMRAHPLWLFLLVSACGPAPQPRAGSGAPRPLPILVDVDMGLDDARVLLALTRQDRFRIDAVITVEGSAAARRGAENALRLLHAAGVDDVPVAIGAERALAGPVPAPPWRGLTEALGGLDLPPARRRLEPVGGVELLRQRLRGAAAPLPCLALGPVTNLVLALRAEPALRRRLSAIYLLGDFWHCDGYNCRTDPDAARELRASGVPLYMVLRAATDAAPFDQGLLERVRRLQAPVARLVAGFMAHHAAPELKLWDDAVLASLLEPGLLPYRTAAHHIHVAESLDRAGLERLLLALWGRP
jgi:pyrimidine-specific ribonucleoside hydrolase